MDSKDLKKNLNHLLERNYDAEKGYKQVAEKIDHTEMKSLMDKNAQDRYRYGHELKTMMGELGIEPNKGTSIEGDAHRAWMSVREVLSMNSDEAILDEAIRGESNAVESYKDVLQDTALQSGHRDILQKQMQEIQQSKSQLEKLKAAV